VKRADNGLAAWHEVHKWYVATSGTGLTEKMTECMNPKQAKNDESVLGELEKWEDTLKEIRGSGATELGADYKLTAIRAIATTFIRDKMDFADTTEDQNDHEARFKSQYESLEEVGVHEGEERPQNRSQPQQVSANGYQQIGKRVAAQ